LGLMFLRVLVPAYLVVMDKRPLNSVVAVVYYAMKVLFVIFCLVSVLTISVNFCEGGRV